MELAIGILATAFLAALLAWVVGLSVTRAHSCEVAAEVARQLARGDQARAEQVRRTAPEGATIDVRRIDGEVRVEVRSAQSFLGFGPVEIRGAAVAALEPGEP